MTPHLTLASLSPRDPTQRRRAFREYVARAPLARLKEPANADSFASAGASSRMDLGGMANSCMEMDFWLSELTPTQRNLLGAPGTFGVNPGLVRWTPLHIAAFFDDIKMAEVVLERLEEQCLMERLDYVSKRRELALVKDHKDRIALDLLLTQYTNQGAAVSPFDLFGVGDDEDGIEVDPNDDRQKVAAGDAKESLLVRVEEGALRSPSTNSGGQDSLVPRTTNPTKDGAAPAPTQAMVMYEMVALLTPPPAFDGSIVRLRAKEKRTKALLELSRFSTLHFIVLGEVCFGTTSPYVFIMVGLAVFLLLYVLVEKVMYPIAGKSASSSRTLTDEVSLPVWAASSVNFLNLTVIIKVIVLKEAIDWSLMFLGLAMFFNDAFTVVDQVAVAVERAGRRHLSRQLDPYVPGQGFFLARFVRAWLWRGWNPRLKRARRMFAKTLSLAFSTSQTVLMSPTLALAYAMRVMGTFRWLSDKGVAVDERLAPFKDEDPDKDQAKTSAVQLLFMYFNLLASDLLFLGVMCVLAIASGSTLGASKLKENAWGQPV